MSSIPNWGSWKEVESHTERVLLFKGGTTVFDKQFFQIIDGINSDLGGDPLTIRGDPAGLQRLDGGLDRLYGNSVWLVNYDLFYRDNKEINSPEEKLRSKFCAEELFPNETRVLVFVENGNMGEEKAKEKVNEDYGIDKICITNNYNTLSGLLKGYFRQVNPKQRSGQKTIYGWSEAMKKVVK